MKPIYLVQRATIKVPLAFDKSTLTDSVRFDYMGSSEFEYGALPASLRRLQSNQKAITTFVAPIYDKKGRHLRILSYLSKEDINLYVGQLCLLRQGGIRTKERTEFSELPSMYDKTDFWWDIENDVMWSFHKEYMNRLEQFLYNSWAIMK